MRTFYLSLRDKVSRLSQSDPEWRRKFLLYLVESGQKQNDEITGMYYKLQDADKSYSNSDFIDDKCRFLEILNQLIGK